MCVYVCVYMCRCVCLHTHVRGRIYIYIYIHTHAHTCMSAHTHIRVYTCMSIYPTHSVTMARIRGSPFFKGLNYRPVSIAVSASTQDTTVSFTGDTS